MFLKRSFLCLVIAVSLCCCGNRARAQHFAQILQPADDTWMVEPWTGDDAQFTAARARISAEMLRSSNTALDNERFKIAAILQPWSSMAAFSMAVANYTAIARPVTEDHAYSWVSSTLQDMQTAPSPHNYEFARIRFLLDVVHCAQNDDLRRLGVRLLSYRGNDPDVLCATGWCFGPKDINKAISYYDKGIALAPNDPWHYLGLGKQCVAAYVSTHDPHYAEMAIASFRKFLSLNPPDKDSRDDASSLIVDTENAMKAMSASKSPSP